MKRNQVTLAALLAALSFLAAPSATALPQTQVIAIRQAVADLPTAELAAAAARLVQQADKSERPEVAVTTVREIVSKKPTTAVAVVGAIAKIAPELSASVAAEAARLSSDQAADIAKAAARCAPGQADKIAAAVAKVEPKGATTVTRAVASVVPDQTPRIVEAVLSSVPSAQVAISQDATITRMSQRASQEGGGQGIITTLPGTISGRAVPNTPPTDAGTPTGGADSSRRYGQP